jgi:catechol-2,3-dioxygenase
MIPAIDGFDHVHVFVSDRGAAEAWYARVLGFERTPHLVGWAADGGPLTLQDRSGAVHLALFEREARPCRSTVALRVGAAAYHAWRSHLEAQLPGQVSEEDHTMSLSLYVRDPDGNPYEITTYEVAQARALAG